MRDSWSGSSTGEMQAAIAALPAFAFQALTASERGVRWALAGAATAASAVAAMAVGEECARHRGTGAR